MDRDESITLGMADSLRPLTDKGRARTQKMIRILKKMEPKLDMIVASPFVRAAQTAELIHEVYKDTQMMESLELIPEASPQGFANWLSQYAKSMRSVLAVGHEPQLSVFASWLACGTPRSFIQIKKAGIVGFELESFESIAPKNAELTYLLAPKLFIE